MVKDFITSIFKINDYKNFKERPWWKPVIYIAMISLFFGLVFSGGVQNIYSKILLLVPENYDSKVPNFVIENNEMKLDTKEKVVIAENGVALIFDSSETADGKVLESYKKGAAFLKDRIVIKTARGIETTRYWKDFNFGRLDKETVRGYLGAIPSLMLMITIASVVGFFGLNLIIALFSSLVFIVIKRLWKKRIKFSEMLRLAIYSTTLPTVLIALVCAIFGDRISFSRYFYAYYLAPIYLLIYVGREEIAQNKAIRPVNKSLKNKKK